MALARKDRDKYRRQLLKAEHAIAVWSARYPEYPELLDMAKIATNLIEGSRLFLDQLDDDDTEAPNPEVGDIDAEWQMLGTDADTDEEAA